MRIGSFEIVVLMVPITGSSPNLLPNRDAFVSETTK